jgi:outer membrane protein OmpA-like peptidoglycan-associated protein
VKEYDYRGGGRRNRIRRPTRNRGIVLGAGGVVVTLIVAVVLLWQTKEPGPEMIWVAEKTTRAPGAIPLAIRDRVKELSGQGGSLKVYAVGGHAEYVGAAALEVTQDGDRISDPKRHAAAVDRRLLGLGKKVAASPVGERGFSLYAALRVGADEAARTGAAVEVWLSTTVLSASDDPLSLPTLTGNETDPGQAVDELMKGPLKDLDLSLIELHLVLLTPVGDEQQPLNPRSESWRGAFLTKLATQLGATVGDPLHDNATPGAWPKSSEVAAIVPMVEKTPEPPRPQPSNEPPEPPRIDNAAFLPDTATLIDPDAVRQAVGQVVAAYKNSPGRYRLTVNGYCANFGSRDGAIRTSRDRATAVSVLLREEGVQPGDISTNGFGFDQRADPAKDPRDPAQRVVVIRIDHV